MDHAFQVLMSEIDGIETSDNFISTAITAVVHQATNRYLESEVDDVDREFYLDTIGG